MDSSQTATQHLTFFLGDEEYAIAILRLRQILDYHPPTRVPTVPSCIRGVINLRGMVVPVIDLALKFGDGESAPTRTTCIIIVELGADDIEPPPPFGTRIRVDFLVGLGKVADRFVLLLDVDKVLSQHELYAAGEIVATAEAPE